MVFHGGGVNHWVMSSGVVQARKSFSRGACRTRSARVLRRGRAWRRSSWRGQDWGEAFQSYNDRRCPRRTIYFRIPRRVGPGRGPAGSGDGPDRGFAADPEDPEPAEAAGRRPLDFLARAIAEQGGPDGREHGDPALVGIGVGRQRDLVFLLLAGAEVLGARGCSGRQRRPAPEVRRQRGGSARRRRRHVLAGQPTRLVDQVTWVVRKRKFMEDRVGGGRLGGSGSRRRDARAQQDGGSVGSSVVLSTRSGIAAAGSSRLQAQASAPGISGRFGGRGRDRWNCAAESRLHRSAARCSAAGRRRRPRRQPRRRKPMSPADLVDVEALDTADGVDELVESGRLLHGGAGSTGPRRGLQVRAGESPSASPRPPGQASSSAAAPRGACPGGLRERIAANGGGAEEW